MVPQTGTIETYTGTCELAPPPGLEPGTWRLEVSRSIQLSYRGVGGFHKVGSGLAFRSQTAPIGEAPLPHPPGEGGVEAALDPLCDLGDEVGGEFGAAVFVAPPKALDRLRRESRRSEKERMVGLLSSA